MYRLINSLWTPRIAFRFNVKNWKLLVCLTSVKWPERDADGPAVEQSGACTVLHQVQSMLE